MGQLRAAKCRWFDEGVGSPTFGRSSSKSSDPLALTFQAAKRKTANERKQGAEKYAIKKLGRAMHGMFAGLLNVVNALETNHPEGAMSNVYEKLTNHTEAAMTNENAQNPAELYILDYAKVLLMIFTAIMMLLYGWVMLRQWLCRRGDQNEVRGRDNPH